MYMLLGVTFSLVSLTGCSPQSDLVDIQCAMGQERTLADTVESDIPLSDNLAERLEILAGNLGMNTKIVWFKDHPLQIQSLHICKNDFYILLTTNRDTGNAIAYVSKSSSANDQELENILQQVRTELGLR